MNARFSYSEILSKLELGPRNKSPVIMEFECLVYDLLNPANDYLRVHHHNESLFFYVESSVYNLTNLFAQQADFDQIEFDEKVMNAYVAFIEANKSRPHFIYCNFDKLKKSSVEHGDLHLAEKIAIYLYTTHINIFKDGNVYERLFNVMNKLLRTSVLDEKARLNEKAMSVFDFQLAILTIAFASHGLRVKTGKNKIVKNVANQSFVLQRQESVSVASMNAERDAIIMQHEDDDDLIFFIEPGFYSTHQDNRELIAPVIIRTESTHDERGMGKSISALSDYPSENEYLFPPGTAFVYLRKTVKNYTIVYQAEPLRPLFEPVGDYHFDLYQLRKEILQLSDDLKTLVDVFATPQSLAEFQDNVSNLCEDKSPALRDSVNQLLPSIAYAKLILHAKSVYELYLSKPYCRKVIDGSVQLGNVIIHRPNHGLAHTMRVALYVQAVVNHFLADESNKKLAAACRALTTQQIAAIQLALLFNVTGRDDEVGFRENPVAYKKFKVLSANQFRKYASDFLQETELEQFASVIEHLGNPDFLKGREELAPFYHVMNLAHKLDLMRCYAADEYISALSMYDATLSISDSLSTSMQVLCRLAQAMLLATGDRLKCRISDKGKIEDTFRPFQDQFRSASSDPYFVFKVCQSALLRFAPVSLYTDCSITSSHQRKLNTTNIYLPGYKQLTQSLNDTVVWLFDSDDELDPISISPLSPSIDIDTASPARDLRK